MIDSKTLNLLDQISPQYLMGGINEVTRDWYSKNDNFEFFKMIYILDGLSEFQLPDQIINPVKGDFLVIPPNTTHSYKQVDNQPLKLAWCHLELNPHINTLLKNLRWGVINKNDKTILNILNEVIYPCGDTTFRKLIYRKSTMLRLFYEYFNHLDSLDFQLHTQDKFYIKVSQFIDSNYQRSITIEELSDLVHLNSNYFHHVFQSHFQMSPIRYINKVRLENAAKLLSKTSSTIHTISLDCGFSDYRYFSRAFKNRYGVTPSQFRNEYGANLNR